jgi:hypothetical protein
VLSILEMMESGQAVMGGKRIRVRTFAEAKRIKISKLYRCMGHVEGSAYHRMKASASHRIPVRHQEAIRTWKRVIDRLSKLTSLKAARQLLR